MTVPRFPSIEQFRHAVRNVRDYCSYHSLDIPTIEFTGTVKLHGTNAGITRDPNGELSFHSRNRCIKLGDDNAGFVAHMSKHTVALNRIFYDISIANNNVEGSFIQIYGEWCGEGIQKGVAITQLPKMFVIFAARIGDKWVSIRPIQENVSASIYNIEHFPKYKICIDFNNPELSQNLMAEITEEVEKRCPVGHAFFMDGIGEGVVWRPSVKLDEPYAALTSDSRLWFKVKGEKHSVSKVSTLAAVDVERFANREKLVAALVTENRLSQGIDYMLMEERLPVTIQNIGTYLRWVFNDIIKEEADTIEASGFEQKELGKPVSDVAKRFYMKAMDNAEAELMADFAKMKDAA